jgi:hypothetical protein
MALLDMQLMGAAALMLVENQLMKSPSLGFPCRKSSYGNVHAKIPAVHKT